ncbi:MAG: biopolymer transporter ExbD [Sinomicrobium sp.]|nr:biopolymer transporter ExbD [Sinomicrobium sp.]
MNASNGINAGSMADIAFLMLIFFLVTTTFPNDRGIQQKLPGDCEECPVPDINERNILRIRINKNDQILADDRLVPLNELPSLVKRFINNNGQLPALSDSPQEAVISLRNDRETSYKTYVSVLNELIAVYTDLRAAYAKRTWNKTMDELTPAELAAVKKAYPQLISEAETR